MRSYFIGRNDLGHVSLLYATSLQVTLEAVQG